MTSTGRKERIANNESSFRQINERLEAGLERVRHRPELLELLCECGDPACHEHIKLTIGEYQALRADSRRFAIVPGHVYSDTERVVSGGPRYEIVEKFGDTVALTDATDRRAPGPGGLRSRDPSP